jgi:phosphonate degradation associated HDIG domain protein
MALTIGDICALFAAKGSRMYSGEPVTQLEHALQSADLAETAGADVELVTAALLHDLGHLLNDQGDTPTAQGIDDVHQYFALPFLRPLFADGVLDAIKLHVDAKRYLCATRPAYYDALSEDSKRSLMLQGGIFDAADAAEFIARPHAPRAVELRLWDDVAKVAGRRTASLEHFVPLMEAAARPIVFK